MTKYSANIYTKGTDPVLDADFEAAARYGKVKPGNTAIFWKTGLRWRYLPMSDIQRIFRRVEPVYGKLCCGGKSFLIEWLVLALHDGNELVIHIGDDAKVQAQALLQALKETHPQLQYGKA